MAALGWTFIGSMVLCYAYATYVILCAIAFSYQNERDNWKNECFSIRNV